MSTKNNSANQSSWSEIGLGVIVPLVFVVVILGADLIEGPKTAYVGVLSAIPILSAVFARPILTAIVGTITWFSALQFGIFASDGNMTSQRVRLVIIAILTLIAILAAYLRVSREKAFYKAKISAARAESIEILAATDLLTGQLNRRGLAEKLVGWNSEHRTLAVLDVDCFKSINDNYGHIVGDESIRVICSRISSNLKGTDVFGRWGGDEFIIALPIPEDEALAVIERVVANSTGAPIIFGDVSFQMSLSAGIAPWLNDQTLEEAFRKADRALYEVKARGGAGVLSVSSLAEDSNP